MDTNRLIPPREGMHIIGVKSPTKYYSLIKSGELPPLIKRGRNSFHLESDLREYVAKLASSRVAA